MLYIVILLSILLTSAVCAVTYLYIKFKKVSKALETLSLKYKTNPSYDCQQLLADLMAGGGIFKIEKYDTEGILIYHR